MLKNRHCSRCPVGHLDIVHWWGASVVTSAIVAVMRIALTSCFLSIMYLPVQRCQATERDASPSW
jgi:hypothetical protein